MKSAEILSNTDRTSWSRISMVWRFYLPYTRSKLIIFASLAILFEIIIFIDLKYLADEQAETITKMLSTFLTVIVGCSALVFAKPKGRELQAMLPALGCEKCVVLIGYVTIIIPLIVSLPSAFAYFILGDEYPPKSVVTSLFSSGEYTQILAYSVLFLEGMALSCLWGVVSTRGKYAMRNGLLAVAAFYFGSMIFISIISFCVGFYAAFTGQEADFANQTHYLFGFMTVICGIYVIFALIKCCHAIKRGQY